MKKLVKTCKLISYTIPKKFVLPLMNGDYHKLTKTEANYLKKFETECMAYAFKNFPQGQTYFWSLDSNREVFLSNNDDIMKTNNFYGGTETYRCTIINFVIVVDEKEIVKQ